MKIHISFDDNTDDNTKPYIEFENAEEEEYHRWLEEQRALPEEKPSDWFGYYPISETHKFTCPRCGRKALDDSSADFHAITSMIEEMKQLGYDVKTERVCSVCSGRSGRHPLDVDTLFYFRYKGMEAYHVAVANRSWVYKVVLSFLRSENAYYGDRDNLKYVSEQRDVIEEMLGIKL